MTITKISKVFLAGFVLAILTKTLFAADLSAEAARQDKLAGMAQEYLAETSQSNSVLVNDTTGAEIPSAKNPATFAEYLATLKWSITNEEHYISGAWLVQYFGRMISIKPGFIRGAYSSRNNSFQITPIAILADVTDIDYSGEVTVYAPLVLGAKQCFSTPSGSLHLDFSNSKLIVSACVNGQPDTGTFNKTITYSTWMSGWRENGKKYCGTVAKDYCFVPQKTFPKRGDLRLSFVLDKGSPLSGSNGVAGDSIEMCKGTVDLVSCVYKNSSPNLYLTFIHAQNESFTWDVYSGLDYPMSDSGLITAAPPFMRLLAPQAVTEHFHP